MTNNGTAVQRWTILLGDDLVVYASTSRNGGESQIGVHASRLIAESDWERFQQAHRRARREGEAWFLFRRNEVDQQWMGHLEFLGASGGTSSGVERFMIWRWQPIEPECCSLSPRQMEILLAFSQGRSPGQIAHTCGISSSTVRTHLLRCQHIIRCHDQFELYRWACVHRRQLLLIAGLGR